MLDTSSVGIPICCGRLNDFLTCSRRADPTQSEVWTGSKREYNKAPGGALQADITILSSSARPFDAPTHMFGLRPAESYHAFGSRNDYGRASAMRFQFCTYLEDITV